MQEQKRANAKGIALIKDRNQPSGFDLHDALLVTRMFLNWNAGCLGVNWDLGLQVGKQSKQSSKAVQEAVRENRVSRLTDLR